MPISSSPSRSAVSIGGGAAGGGGSLGRLIDWLDARASVCAVGGPAGTAGFAAVVGAAGAAVGVGAGAVLSAEVADVLPILGPGAAAGVGADVGRHHHDRCQGAD